MGSNYEKISFKKSFAGLLLFIFIIIFFILKIQTLEDSTESTRKEIAKRHFMEESIEFIRKGFINE